MSSTLTPEQRQKIEENRRIALQKRAAKLNSQIASTTPISVPTSSVQSFYSSKPHVGNVYAKQNSTQKVFRPNSFQPSSSNSNSFKSLNSKTSSGSNASTSFTKTWNLSSEILCGNVHLISRDRFSVDVGYNSKVIDFFKTISGRSYDTEKKSWNFPLSSYTEFKEKASSISSLCVFGSLTPAILETFMDKEKNKPDSYENIDLSTIDPVLLARLFPFQKDGIRFGISKGGKCLIADDMGLGKTVQALALAHYYVSDWPLLIVCPSSMRFQWQEEITTNLPSIPSYKTFVIISKKDHFEEASVIIISYDLMSKLKDSLKSYKFGIIIMDESHCLKSGKSQRTKVALELTASSKRVILLSGTPALSRPIELFTQIKAVSPCLFRDMISYGIRYCEGKQDRFGWNFNGSSNLEELRLLLEEKIMIRRLKVDVLEQLPSKMRYVVVLNSEKIDSQSKSMNAFAKKLNAGTLKGADKRSTLLAYFAETGRAKIKAICEHIEQILEQNTKFLIFAHHKEVMNAICETLESKETFYIRIDGSVSSEERKQVCDQFQQEEKFRVAVLSIKAANVGVTLTAAQLVIFAELYWNPGELIQAEDRAHRLGQKGCVTVQYLLAKKTADDFIWPLVQAKLNVLSQAGLSKDSSLKIESLPSEPQLEMEQQAVITNYFSFLEEDDFIDEELANVLDEIEQNIPEKRPRMDC